jgi:hypothetical protein
MAAANATSVSFLHAPAIPVVVFAYARPNHLRVLLRCLKENQVPRIVAYSDGARTVDQVTLVNEVRSVLRQVDWCDIHIHERSSNWGLGRSILAGITDVLQTHEAAIVAEDDLLCVPGTYAYLCAALHHYRDCPEVMSVAGWTHPRVKPPMLLDQPYCDGRACCWFWGTWARAWRGMAEPAEIMMGACKQWGIDVGRYGADLPAMAVAELTDNIWAVRWAYHHILNEGLCLRPPWSMVEHTGDDEAATHRSSSLEWSNQPLGECPPLPMRWPEPRAHPDCARLWQRAFPQTPASRLSQSSIRRLLTNVRTRIMATLKRPPVYAESQE